MFFLVCLTKGQQPQYGLKNRTLLHELILKRHYLNVAPKPPNNVKDAQRSAKKNERHYLNVAPKIPNADKATDKATASNADNTTARVVSPCVSPRVSPRVNKGKAAKKFGFDS